MNKIIISNYKIFSVTLLFYLSSCDQSKEPDAEYQHRQGLYESTQQVPTKENDSVVSVDEDLLQVNKSVLIQPDSTITLQNGKDTKQQHQTVSKQLMKQVQETSDSSEADKPEVEIPTSNEVSNRADSVDPLSIITSSTAVKVGQTVTFSVIEAVDDTETHYLWSIEAPDGVNFTISDDKKSTFEFTLNALSPHLFGKVVISVNLNVNHRDLGKVMDSIDIDLLPKMINDVVFQSQNVQRCINNMATENHLQFVNEVTAIDCSDQSISNPIDLYQFTSIKALNISNNPLHSLDISTLPYLETLNISHTELASIEGIIHSTISTLDVSSTPLSRQFFIDHMDFFSTINSLIGINCAVDIAHVFASNNSVEQSDFDSLACSNLPISLEESVLIQDMLWQYYTEDLPAITIGTESRFNASVSSTEMTYHCFQHGIKPDDGFALFISLHGGGGTAPSVNDQQYRNQKTLYDSHNVIKNSIYCAFRANTNTWDLWHKAYLDNVFTQFISAAIVSANVNSNRVYLTGYSAGGDGTYQLAPRMADRWAAANMNAGHPNETKIDGLRNVPFALFVGLQDTAYNRAGIALDWKNQFNTLHQQDPLGYFSLVETPNTGHWMNGADKRGITYVQTFTRNLQPDKVVWLQDNVIHRRSYWLVDNNPTARKKIIAEFSDNTFKFMSDASGVDILLNDKMVDFSKNIIVRDKDDVIIFEDKVDRRPIDIYNSLWINQERGIGRGDKAAIMNAKISF